MEYLILSPDDFASHAADRIAREILDLGGSRAALSLALSGGNTPGPVNRALARRSDIPWGRIDLYFADERAVPLNAPESNYRMVRESLLDHLPAPLHAVHRMEAEREEVAQAAADYAALLPDQLDLLLLGLGEDGHTASLFPIQTDPDDPRRVFSVVAPKPPPLRMTIGPRLVQAAGTRRIVLVQGGSKASAVAMACEGPWNPSACPGQLARDGLWILDQPAARELGGN
ncbi:MAG: 6-phosphogluconolactonase [Gemmatimonadota bacterium]